MHFYATAQMHHSVKLVLWANNSGNADDTNQTDSNGYDESFFVLDLLQTVHKIN